MIALEKSRYPRDKVCGDGLTPRAVKELDLMGVPTPAADGWIRNKGLRMVGGGHRLNFPWPQTPSYPDYGLTLPRAQFDHILAQHARSTGADIREGWAVVGAIRDDNDRVIGVRARETNDQGRKIGPEVEFRAPLVIAADGVSARVALETGRERRKRHPMGVAVRTYYQTERRDEEWMEGHLEVWRGEPRKSKLLPGYGWIFPLADGVVNVGLGTLSGRGKPSKLDHRSMLDDWIRHSTADWELTPERRIGPVLGAGIPMAFNRKPHYRDGLMLVGDSGGMVNPFNGEGIAYAMLAARRAAEAMVDAREAATDKERERALQGYVRQLKGDLGGYYRLGLIFAGIIDKPAVMKICTRYGLPRQNLMWFTHKLLSDVYEPRGGDWADRIIATLARMAPSA